MHITQEFLHLEFEQKRRHRQGMWLSFLSVLLVLTFLPGAPAFAANYYVAKNGNNSGPGSQAQPWLTVQHAANQVKAGDTVNVKAGTYNERVVLSASGSAAGGYITFQNFQGDKPVLDGTGLGNGRMVVGEHVKYIKFMGFHIKNHTGAGIVFRGKSGFIEIRNNEISNQTHQKGHGHAILVLGAYSWPYIFPELTNVIIDNNYIHDVQTGVGTAYNEALTLGHNVSKFQITNNVLDNVSYIGIDCIGKTSAGPNKHPRFGIIADNEVKNSGTFGSDSGIYLDGATDVVIERNKVHDNVGYGFTISTEDTKFTTKRIIVRRNESWNNFRNMTPSATGSAGSEGIRAVHNVLYTDRAGKRNLSLFYGNDIIVKNNISSTIGGNYHIENYSPYNLSSPSLNFNTYYPDAGTYYSYQAKTHFSLADYQSKTGHDKNSISQNPLFVNAANRDFQLQSNSPSIDAGGFLTTTTSGGSGTTIPVEDSLYFSDGFGLVPGDLVQVGSNSPARIIRVDHNAKTLTVDRSISWIGGSGVSYPYTGSAPDMGVYEQGGASSPDTKSPAAPVGLVVQ